MLNAKLEIEMNEKSKDISGFLSNKKQCDDCVVLRLEKRMLWQFAHESMHNAQVNCTIRLR